MDREDPCRGYGADSSDDDDVHRPMPVPLVEL
jgi:hypothetical protein